MPKSVRFIEKPRIRLFERYNIIRPGEDASNKMLPETDFVSALDGQRISEIAAEYKDYTVKSLSCEYIDKHMSIEQKEQMLKTIADEVFKALEIDKSGNTQAWYALIDKMTRTNLLKHSTYHKLEAVKNTTEKIEEMG
ncbi:unnamed protein product [Clonostachys rosea f. rosea IK726]|jgi:hypothetical protein|uniref:Uncharacterized protein n=1 Tax=Clonostachys rosea f. rosea IK726 TaxID=1349383 RepID=A0ACA9TDA3_BIOOC|nr:unnamed protein product [Clonostachys rosea f. rosea IK726]